MPVDPEPGPLTPRLIVLVAAGGAAGTGVRYAIAQGIGAHSGFPWETLLANLAGSLVLGVLLEMLSRRGPDTGGRRKARLLVGTGFCGGLTTYSSFVVEADLLVRSHRGGLALTYAVATVVGGLIAAGLGIAAAARLRRPAS